MTLVVAQVIRKMDVLLGISDDITMGLVGHVSETEIEMKLDLQICTSDVCTISASMLGDGARTLPTAFQKQICFGFHDMYSRL